MGEIWHRGRVYPIPIRISIEKRKSQHQSTEYTLIKMGLIHKIEEKVLHHGDKKHAQQQYMYTVFYLF
jgi:hypothetical protein